MDSAQAVAVSSKGGKKKRGAKAEAVLDKAASAAIDAAPAKADGERQPGPEKLTPKQRRIAFAEAVTALQKQYGLRIVAVPSLAPAEVVGPEPIRKVILEARASLDIVDIQNAGA